MHTVELSFGNRKIVVETGRMAKQASGSVLVRDGDSVVLVAVAVAPDVKAAQDFFPLTVDYRERTYAAGRIPGGFFKRETRAREKETLTSRLIDRSVRPLFPEGFLNAVQVSALVLSSDQVYDTDIMSIVGASVALSISIAPFAGPIAAVRIGEINGQFVINPTFPEQKDSTLELVVAGNKDSIMMIESGAQEISEEKMLEALTLAQKEIKISCQEQEQFIKTHGKPKMVFVPETIDAKLQSSVESVAREKIRQSVRTPDKAQREDSFSAIKKEIVSSLNAQYPEQSGVIGAIIEKILYEEARALILDDKVRADGRKYTDIRPITCEVGVLPRTHGSALFTRGQTQALVTVTLGTPEDQQIIDDLEGEFKERFMLHYNFPGFATGECRPDRSPGRREIGHGALARKALLPLLPVAENFPYTLRIVSDIFESNGSSSMASVCGGSLALFDTGVQTKAPCSGIAMGLIVDERPGKENNVAILSDILGMEDHLGDMDFKVAGTADGITALQLDLKIHGISLELLARALQQAKAGRLHILGKMNEALSVARGEFSAFAPKMTILRIPVEKIGALIGPGGKNIRKIIEESGAEVNVEDDGQVFLSGTDAEAVERARAMVQGCTAEAEVGRVYQGRVTRIMEFGAFVEILPGKEGLVHVSQLDLNRVENVTDVVKEGDPIEVKCVEIDNQGRVNLSRKAVLLGDKDPGNYSRPPARPSSSRPRGSFGGRR